MRDYCTDGLDIVWPWNDCCYQHDQSYVAQTQARSEVDAVFYSCVTDEGGWWYALLAFPIVAIGGAYLWFRRRFK